MSKHKGNIYWQRLPPEAKDAFAKEAFEAWLDTNPPSTNWHGSWENMPTDFKNKWKGAAEAIFSKLNVQHKEQ